TCLARPRPCACALQQCCLAIGATVAGHTPIALTSTPPAVPQIENGKLRALAVTSRTRSPVLPSVPTMAESGYPETEGGAWFALVVPARTPKPIIELLHRELGRIVALPEMKERMAPLGFEPLGTTPEESAAYFRTERVKWAKVIREAGIKAE